LLSLLAAPPDLTPWGPVAGRGTMPIIAGTYVVYYDLVKAGTGPEPTVPVNTRAALGCVTVAP
jgi:hypothetical protein